MTETKKYRTTGDITKVIVDETGKASRQTKLIPKGTIMELTDEERKQYPPNLLKESTAKKVKKGTE